MEDYIYVGKIVGTRLKGEVKVISETDFKDERYRKGSEIISPRQWWDGTRHGSKPSDP